MPNNATTYVTPCSRNSSKAIVFFFHAQGNGKSLSVQSGKEEKEIEEEGRNKADDFCKPVFTDFFKDLTCFHLSYPQSYTGQG